MTPLKTSPVRSPEKCDQLGQLYDNRLGSTLPFEAQTEALCRLMRQDRLEKSEEKMLCHGCLHEMEMVKHVVLQWDRLGTGRKDTSSEGNTPLHAALGFKEDGSVNVRDAVMFVWARKIILFRFRNYLYWAISPAGISRIPCKFYGIRFEGS